MPRLDVEQGSPQWLAARAGRFSASRFPDLMARLKNGKPGASWESLVSELVRERLTGQKTEFFATGPMRRGIELEPEARQAYEDATLTAVEEIGMYVHDELDFVSCSPDGLIGDEGMLEIKCMMDANHINTLLNDYALKAYHWQLQGQMWVAKRKWCHLACYHPDFPPGMKLKVYHVEYDEKCAAELEKACIEADQAVNKRVEKLRAKYPEEGLCITEQN